ncbi:hypothetical protein Mgra_00002330, partial [Meloidogyne graminicola]
IIQTNKNNYGFESKRIISLNPNLIKLSNNNNNKIKTKLRVINKQLDWLNINNLPNENKNEYLELANELAKNIFIENNKQKEILEENKIKINYLEKINENYFQNNFKIIFKFLLFLNKEDQKINLFLANDALIAINLIEKIYFKYKQFLNLINFLKQNEENISDLEKKIYEFSNNKNSEENLIKIKKMKLGAFFAAKYIILNEKLIELLNNENKNNIKENNNKNNILIKINNLIDKINKLKLFISLIDNIKYKNNIYLKFNEWFIYTKNNLKKL